MSSDKCTQPPIPRPEAIPEPAPMNDRGFLRSTFEDIYGATCSIQDSSLATRAAIWLGQQRCEKCDAPCRMHLSQELAAGLIPMLQRFVETGSIGPVPTPTDRPDDGIGRHELRRPSK